MSIVRQGTLPVGSLDHAITLNVQGSGGSHFETVTNTTPYLHRASPQDVASSMKLKKVVGGTIAWTQLSNGISATTESNGVTFTKTNDTTLTLSGISSAGATRRFNNDQAISIVTGHKYLLHANHANVTKVVLYIYENNWSSPSVPIGLSGGIVSASSTSSTARFCVSIATNIDVNGIILVPQLFDLTQMFGSTIADYLYSLEQAHAGDGVAWFKALFGEDYYPYNAGELMSVKTSAHKTVGFNQWDEEWEVGGYNTSGQPTQTANEMRCKNFIPALPNTQYCFTAPVWGVIYQYDADKNFLLRTPLIGGDKSPLFTTLANTAYIKFFMQAAYGITYNNDICINLSSSRNGEYEPYKEYTYPLDSDLELRGIPKLDSNNKLYYDGDIYASDGTVTRKYGIRAYTEGDATDGSTMITDGTNTVYKLTTSTTESADAYTESQRVGATEEFVDARSVPIPVGNESEYKRLIQGDTP